MCIRPASSIVMHSPGWIFDFERNWRILGARRVNQSYARGNQHRFTEWLHWALVRWLESRGWVGEPGWLNHHQCWNSPFMDGALVLWCLGAFAWLHLLGKNLLIPGEQTLNKHHNVLGFNRLMLMPMITMMVITKMMIIMIMTMTTMTMTTMMMTMMKQMERLGVMASAAHLRQSC